MIQGRTLLGEPAFDSHSRIGFLGSRAAPGHGPACSAGQPSLQDAAAVAEQRTGPAPTFSGSPTLGAPSFACPCPPHLHPPRHFCSHVLSPSRVPLCHGGPAPGRAPPPTTHPESPAVMAKTSFGFCGVLGFAEFSVSVPTNSCLQLILVLGTAVG